MNTAAVPGPAAPVRTGRMELAQAIRLSLRAFVYGFFALLPVVGFFASLYVMVCALRVRSGFYPQWNPAAKYLRTGLVLAVLAFGAHVLLVLSIWVTNL